MREEGRLFVPDCYVGFVPGVLLIASSQSVFCLAREPFALCDLQEQPRCGVALLDGSDRALSIHAAGAHGSCSA